jgi:DNA-binding NarL/FixJ family response regulator
MDSGRCSVLKRWCPQLFPFLGSENPTMPLNWQQLSKRISFDLRGWYQPRQFQKLTPAEVNTLNLVAQGFTHSEIAFRLGVSVRTGRNRMTEVGEKLGTSNQVSAVLSGICLELVDLPAAIENFDLSKAASLSQQEKVALRSLLEVQSGDGSNEEIAEKLCKNKGTVKRQLSDVYAKLRLNRVQAVLFYLAAEQADRLGS